MSRDNSQIPAPNFAWKVDSTILVKDIDINFLSNKKLPLYVGNTHPKHQRNYLKKMAT